MHWKSLKLTQQLALLEVDDFGGGKLQTSEQQSVKINSTVSGIFLLPNSYVNLALLLISPNDYSGEKTHFECDL